MNIQLQEIKNIFIKNRLTEGVDFVRKEWLKGTEGCYIDTLINPAWNDQLSATAKASGQPTDRWIFILTASGSKSSILLCTNRWWVEYNNPSVVVSQRRVEVSDNIEFTGFSATAEIYISLKVTNNATPTYSCKINGSAWSGKVSGSNIITTLPDTTYIIGDRTTGLDVLKLKNVKINSHNFIPCQLLHAIPATLDANNIARSAGECGMYDSISGKFFGNVANSGTFTVEGDVEPEIHSGLQQIYQNKLIEGVDYETYDWLKADIPLNVKMMKLPVNSNNVEYDIQRLKLGNTTLFDSNNGKIKYFFWGNGYTIGVHGRVNNESPHDLAAVSYNSNIILFHVLTTVTSVKINNINLQAYYFPINNILFNVQYGSNDDITLTSSIKVDGVTRYVPCQLLKPIPRNLDAQCKERVAGECGMIDLISGKFYGNVANSGTFTVENDSNE